eukprot:m.125568 g.125568  ORF g.125568 m.125568 type:complete len:274 (-) comp19787_c0_seq1:24-845(-)
MGLGISLSQAVFPLTNSVFIAEYGWRSTWVLWSVAETIVFIPLTLLFVNNVPLHSETNTSDSPGSRLPVLTRRDSTFTEATRSYRFWLLMYCVLQPSLINTGIVYHIHSIVEGNGLPRLFAPAFLSSKALFGLPASFLSGFLAERCSPHYLLAMSYVLQAALLALLSVPNSRLAVLAAGACLGSAAMLGNIVLGVLLPLLFGLKAQGSIQGIVMTGAGVASAAGPAVFAYLFDAYHTYRPVLLFSIPLAFSCIGCSLWLTHYRALHYAPAKQF